MPTGIIVNNAYYHHRGSGSLFALDATNGGYIWRKNTFSSAFIPAINYENGTFVSVGNRPNHVFAFDQSGKELWSHEFNSTFSGFSDGPLAIGNGIIVGGYLQNTSPGKLYTDDGYRATQNVYALRLRGADRRQPERARLSSRISDLFSVTAP